MKKTSLNLWLQIICQPFRLNNSLPKMFLPFAAAELSAAAVYEVSLPPAPGVPCSFRQLCPETEILPGFHSILRPLARSAAAGSAAETSWSVPAADGTAVKHKHTNMLHIINI